MCEQYENMMKYGLREARRRAQRAGRLSELKEKREESWWREFVSEFKKDGRNPMDLVFIEMLSKVPTFSESTIASVYKEGLIKHKAQIDQLKEMLTRINELGHVIEPYKLLMVFKDVESQIYIDNLVAAETKTVASSVSSI